VSDEPPDVPDRQPDPSSPPPPRPDLAKPEQLKSGVAVASLVMGILSWPLTPLWLGWIASTLAIIYGVRGRGRATPGSSRMKMATWGLGLGIANLVVFLAILMALSSTGAP
jgi:hypothetical protein